MFWRGVFNLLLGLGGLWLLTVVSCAPETDPNPSAGVEIREE